MKTNSEITPQQSLCLACGLCCDGTLFAKVTLKPDDVLPVLETAGIEIQVKDTKKFFRLPCVGFQNNCCQVYAGRPTNCRQFRCELLKKYDAEQVSQSAAEQQIKRAQKLRDLIRAEIAEILPEAAQYSIPVILRMVPENKKMIADPALLKKWGGVMMNLAALLDLLKTHFRHPPKVEETAEEQV